jgi:hypothetical protein
VLRHIERAEVKWQKISNFVNAAQDALCNWRSPQGCKDKWASLYADYKHVKDYKKTTRYNKDYFNMSTSQRKELGLLLNLQQVHYNQMDCFFTQRPCLNPLRACDLLEARETECIVAPKTMTMATKKMTT